MITGLFVTIMFGIMLVIAAGGIIVFGVVASGVALVMLDILIGLSPFIGLVLMIRWLCKDKEEEDKKKEEKK